MKQFGHERPLRKSDGEIERMVDSPARAVTRDVLGAAFGLDKARRLVVSLERGDLVCLRPSGTRRVYRCEAKDLFHWLLRCEANRLTLERARDKKQRKAQRLANERQSRAEKRLFHKNPVEMINEALGQRTAA